MKKKKSEYRTSLSSFSGLLSSSSCESEKKEEKNYNRTQGRKDNSQWKSYKSEGKEIKLRERESIWTRKEREEKEWNVPLIRKEHREVPLRNQTNTFSAMNENECTTK